MIAESVLGNFEIEIEKCIIFSSESCRLRYLEIVTSRREDK